MKKSLSLTIAVILIAAMLCACSSGQSNNSSSQSEQENLITDTWSSSFKDKDEKLAFLHKYLEEPSQILDGEFHIVYYDNSTGRVPGPSDHDIRVALKVNPEDINLWTPDFEEISADEVDISWWYGLAKEIISWDFNDGAVYYKRPDSNSSYMVIFPDQGIILKAFSTLGNLSFKGAFSGISILSNVLEDNGYYYYFSSDGINRVNKANPEKDWILYQSDIRFIKLYEDKIYYTYWEAGNSDQVLYSIDITGENKQIVWDGTGYEDGYSVSGVEFYNGMIYIRNGYDIVQYNPVTKETGNFLEMAYKAAFFGGYIYYIPSKAFTLYRMDIDTRQSSVLCGKETSACLMVDNVAVCDNQLYYTDRAGARLFRYVEDENDVLINHYDDKDFYNIMADDGNLWYISSFEKWTKFELYKMDGITEECTFIAELPDCNPAFMPNIAQNLIIYRTKQDAMKMIDLSA